MRAEPLRRERERALRLKLGAQTHRDIAWTNLGAGGAAEVHVAHGAVDAAEIRPVENIENVLPCYFCVYVAKFSSNRECSCRRSFGRRTKMYKI